MARRLREFRPALASGGTVLMLMSVTASRITLARGSYRSELLFALATWAGAAVCFGLLWYPPGWLWRAYCILMIVPSALVLSEVASRR